MADMSGRWRAGVVAFLALACGAMARPPDHAGIVFAERENRPLTLDLYLPDAPRPAPLVVFIHGGGWRGGSPRQVEPLLFLGDEGFAVASISYRFSHEARFPAQLEDVREALCWLASHGHRLGFDPDRMALVGASAGGHLAMLAAVAPEVGSPPIRAVVSYFGASDFLLRAKSQPGPVNNPRGSVYELLGGPLADREALAREASPAFHVSPSTPPLLLFHGTADRVVLADQSERIAQACQAAGRPVTLRIKKDAGHSLSDFSDPESRAALRDFLTQHLVRKESLSNSRNPLRGSFKENFPSVSPLSCDSFQHHGQGLIESW